MELTYANGKVHQPQDAYQPLTKADQATIRTLWPTIRRGCQRVKLSDSRGDVAPWDVTHVRMQLDLHFAGRSTAECWLMKDRENAWRGFMVTLVGTCPYRQVQNTLIIWIAYTFRPIPGWMRRAVDRQLEDYAASLGLEHIDGFSTNEKWIKYLSRYGKGYRVAQIMFRKDVFDERR